MRALFALPALLLAAPALACGSVTSGDLTISDAWSRASIGAARPGVVYLTIRNDGAEDDVLTGVATPAAAKPMLHETVVTDGVASMPHVMAIPVPAGQTVALAPRGFHVMLMDLAAPLAEGAAFPVTLTFERAGEVAVEAEVLALAAMEPRVLNRRTALSIGGGAAAAAWLLGLGWWRVDGPGAARAVVDPLLPSPLTEMGWTLTDQTRAVVRPKD